MTTDFDDRQADDVLMAKARELETAIAPERDLWPEIEASIDADVATVPDAGPERGAPRRYLAQAAAVLLLVGASSAITYKLTKTEATVSPVVTGVELPARLASFGGEYPLGPDYGLAHVAVESQLNAMLAHLSPESRAGVEANLQVIRDAIAEINTALESEPDNALLQGLLVRAYREELAVMHKIGGLTHDVMSRNDI